jgi:hypothetical protein
MKFSPTGEFITKWGDKGEFEDPEHLAVDSEGNVYVSDRGKNKVILGYLVNVFKLSERKLGLNFQDKETVLELNSCRIEPILRTT